MEAYFLNLRWRSDTLHNLMEILLIRLHFIILSLIRSAFPVHTLVSLVLFSASSLAPHRNITSRFQVQILTFPVRNILMV